jgi:hypothetical protein
MTNYPQHPKRGEHSYWENDEPYTDVHIVLELLNKQSPTYEPNHLDRCTGEEYDWEIIVPWFTYGSSGGDRSGHNYHQIDTALAKELVDNGWVEPRKILHMGYTETRENEFVISPAGKKKLEAYLSEMKARAESLLVPGVHTDLTGSIRYRGHRRDDWGWGPIYLIFDLPEDRGQCHVYPDEGKIVMPEDSTAEAT